MIEVKRPNKERLIEELDRIIEELKALREEWSATEAEPTLTVPAEELKEEDFFAHVDDLSLDELFVATVAESEAYNVEIEAEEDTAPIVPPPELRFSLVNRLSLLDSYHFAQGLFAGDQTVLRETLWEVEKMSSLPQAKDLLQNHLGIDIESEVGEQFWSFIEQNSHPA